MRAEERPGSGAREPASADAGMNTGGTSKCSLRRRIESCPHAYPGAPPKQLPISPNIPANIRVRWPLSASRAPFFFFRSKLVILRRSNLLLINNGAHPASALHSDIRGATMVRKKVIEEPQNLNHNVVPKRAEIGRCTPVNALGAPQI